MPLSKHFGEKGKEVYLATKDKDSSAEPKQKNKKKKMNLAQKGY